MRKPHFFAAHSRLGVRNNPIGSTDDNRGVEDAPAIILNNAFLSSLQNRRVRVNSFLFSDPDRVSAGDYQETLATDLAKFQQVIDSHLQADHTQVVIGGDHSVAFSSLSSVLQRDPDIGMILFDSHGELNKFSDSPTGNFHGMWLRPFLGDFDSPEIASLVARPLPAENLLMIGDLSLQSGEKRFIQENKIKNIDRAEIHNDPKKVLKFIEEFRDRFQHLHLSFDVDVFDQSIVSATGSPAESGLFESDIIPILEVAARARSLSLDLTEVNPQKLGRQETVSIAWKVIRKCLDTSS